MVFLASDNTSGATAEVMAAIENANNMQHTKAYGADQHTSLLTQKFCEIFELSDLVAFPVFNGSAANCLGLANIQRPYEAVIAHRHSHIQQDECGMPEFFTGGKVLNVVGENGKIESTEIKSIIDTANSNGIHHSHPKVISITQSTEFGTTYKPEEILALSALKKNHELLLHMDGARFANAVASIGCKPSEITWKAGVDVMSFGGTKNGALLAEAVIFFKPELAQGFERLRKRAGQLASKQRYLSAQLIAMLEDGRWIKTAAHANEMAKILATGMSSISRVKIMNPVEANSIFACIPHTIAHALLEMGHYFYHWPLLGENVYRLVTSYNTTLSDINSFLIDFESCASNS